MSYILFITDFVRCHNHQYSLKDYQYICRCHRRRHRLIISTTTSFQCHHHSRCSIISTYHRHHGRARLISRILRTYEDVGHHRRCHGHHRSRDHQACATVSTMASKADYETDEKADRAMEKETDMETGRETDRETNKETNRETNRETEKETA